MRILLFEENIRHSEWLAAALRQERYAVDCVHSREDAAHALETVEYGLAIFDFAFPHGHDLAMIRRLRMCGSSVSIIVLTANDSLTGRISALNAGADDYLAKPFDISELAARIRVQLRRTNHHKDPIVSCGGLALDSNTRQFTLNERPLALTPREYSVLEALIVRAGITVSRTALGMSVFDYEDEVLPNAIEIYVHRVRKKLAGSNVAIVTRRSVGYALKESSVQQLQSAAV